MAIALPTTPLPFQASPQLLDYGGDMKPPLGGPAQRFGRLGSRWRVGLVWQAMGRPYAEAFLAQRFAARAAGSTLIAAWPQPAVADALAGIAGAVVGAAGQTGTSLAIAGAGAGTIPAGAFFSVAVAGRNYLYVATAAAALAGGAATLAIAPMLRASPASGAALNFVTPQIEGFASGQAEAWTLDRMAWSTFKLTLEEVQ